MKRVLMSVAVAVALGSTVYAGGDYVPAVTPVTVDEWSGPYIGLQAGYSWGDADVAYDVPVTTGNFTHALVNRRQTLTSSPDPDGFIGGIYAGYNWLLQGNWLIGIEGDWSFSSADDTAAITDPNGNALPNVATKVEQNWDASLRLRAGKVIDNYLLYVTGGVAWADLDVTLQSGSNSYTESMTFTGWTIGAGLEIKISGNLHGRIQYRYTDYGDEAGTINNIPVKVDYNSHMVTIGLSYRF